MGLALDEPTVQDDIVTISGIPFLIDPQVRPFASGQLLDYGPTFGGSGFFMRQTGGQGGC